MMKRVIEKCLLFVLIGYGFYKFINVFLKNTPQELEDDLELEDWDNIFVEDV